MGKIKENDKVQKLEDEITEQLEHTGLFSNIHFYRGNLKLKKDLPYLEYRLKNGRRGVPEKIAEKAEELSIHVINKLIRHNKGVIEINSVLNNRTGIYKHELLVNPEARLIDYSAFRCRILNDIKKEIDNYLMQIT